MASADSTDEDLVPRKGSHVTSIIWKWFGFKKSDVEQTIPTCKVCRTIIKTKNSSTTNLFQHLRQSHAKEWEECTALRECAAGQSKPQTQTVRKQQTLAASFSHAVPYDRSGTRWKQMTEALAIHIGMDMVPIYTVEKCSSMNDTFFQ